jgi:hypothetical protein
MFSTTLAQAALACSLAASSAPVPDDNVVFIRTHSASVIVEACRLVPKCQGTSAEATFRVTSPSAQICEADKRSLVEGDPMELPTIFWPAYAKDGVLVNVGAPLPEPGTQRARNAVDEPPESNIAISDRPPSGGTIDAAVQSLEPLRRVQAPTGIDALPDDAENVLPTRKAYIPGEAGPLLPERRVTSWPTGHIETLWPVPAAPQASPDQAFEEMDSAIMVVTSPGKGMPEALTGAAQATALAEPVPLPRPRSETDASTCEYDHRHRLLLSDDPQTQKYLLLLPSCIKLVEKGCPTAACAWAAGLEQAGDAVERRIIRGLVDTEEREIMRAEFDTAVREECAQRPFEMFFSSVRGTLFGDAPRCPMFPPPWRDWY